jgi:hypothetical protein
MAMQTYEVGVTLVPLEVGSQMCCKVSLENMQVLLQNFLQNAKQHGYQEKLNLAIIGFTITSESLELYTNMKCCMKTYDEHTYKFCIKDHFTQHISQRE